MGLPTIATEFEFRHRFGLVVGCAGLAMSALVFWHTPAGAALAELAGASLREGVRFAFILAALGIMAGALLRTWGTAYLSARVVFDFDLRKDRLVADGPYRHVRNPLYLGSLLMGAGVSLILPWPGCLLMLVGFAAIYRRLIGREELELESALSARYAAYTMHVPRLWPSLRPRLAAGEGKPNWKDGFLGESLVWGAGALMLVYAWTLNFNPLIWAWMALFAFSVTAQFLRLRTLRAHRAKERAAATNRDGEKGAV